MRELLEYAESMYIYFDKNSLTCLNNKKTKRPICFDFSVVSLFINRNTHDLALRLPNGHRFCYEFMTWDLNNKTLSYSRQLKH